MNAASPTFGSVAPAEPRTRLFVGSFIAIITIAIVFVVRAFLLSEWRVTFNLSESQLGSIQGAGLYPQALAIILFSLVIDRVGYGRVMAFAFLCHLLSAFMTITATGYSQLYWGTFVFALGAGPVETVVNPVVATLYPQQQNASPQRWARTVGSPPS